MRDARQNWHVISRSVPLTAVALATLAIAAGEARAAGALEYLPPSHLRAELASAARRGEIPDPSTRPDRHVAPRTPRADARGLPLDLGDIFAYEDTEQVLVSNFSDGELVQLMIDAANAVMLTHGDNFDFIGYWVNSTPHHTLGAAFYAGIENDVSGIGDSSGEGEPLYNFRDEIGLFGNHVEGFIMMWNINSSGWQPGTTSAADFTRLALAQEFEHRFAMFLPDLLDGRSLQGDNGSCGRVWHWSWRVDGQGSGMEIAEWVGASPPVLDENFISFNTDIPGSVFSYSDLYLMGYVSAEEMDAGNSELRFMNGSSCVEGSSHAGPVTTFTSADIIASAGPRVPDHVDEDKHYRTAWVMLHQPGDPPTTFERDKAIQILEQHQLDWSTSTLGRGSMDNSLGEIVSTPELDAGRLDVSLLAPVPNPLRAAGASVRYSLSAPAEVGLAIHDVAGRRVATIDAGSRDVGEHVATWDGRDHRGARVSPGVYFLLLDAGGARSARRVTVVE